MTEVISASNRLYALSVTLDEERFESQTNRNDVVADGVALDTAGIDGERSPPFRALVS